MIKKCLYEIISNAALVEFHKKVNSLYDMFDDNHLEYVLGRGVTIDEYSNILLYFNGKVGFRCMNTNAHYIGNLPICNQVEKVLNNKYTELIMQLTK